MYLTSTRVFEFDLNRQILSLSVTSQTPVPFFLISSFVSRRVIRPSKIARARVASDSNRRRRRAGNGRASARQDGGFRWSRQCIQRERSER